MPPHWLSRPGPAPDAATRAEFDALLAALAAGPGTEIDYRLAAPKWQFLCHVADRGEAVLHGSSAPDIARFEPRQSNDIAEFGNRRAVYAAADGLWALYFADPRPAPAPDVADQQLLPGRGRGRDRERAVLLLLGQQRGRWSRASSARARSTCCRPEVRAGGRRTPRAAGRVLTAQAASLEPVEPLAKLPVEPADFPLRIRGHDLPRHWPGSTPTRAGSRG